MEPAAAGRWLPAAAGPAQRPGPPAVTWRAEAEAMEVKVAAVEAEA
eukprot:COSAG05_NODE_1445_length_4869_cov_17.898349_1_plen_46_part_00